MKRSLYLIAIIAAAPAFAEDSRHLDAHEHGVGKLNIAIDGGTMAMEFHAPGADIVGFEYAAESEADLAAIDDAIAVLDKPLDLFIVPDAAGCTVTEAHAELEGDDDHDEHGSESDHTEFHAEYSLTCDSPDALTEIKFAYFGLFPNAKEVEVQMITTSGAQAFEVPRDTPILNLER